MIAIQSHVDVHAYSLGIREFDYTYISAIDARTYMQGNWLIDVQARREVLPPLGTCFG